MRWLAKNRLSLLVANTCELQKDIAMLGRSTSSSVVLVLINLLALATGGVLLFRPTPRELSVREKEELRGGQYVGKCCELIPQCGTLPSYNDCGWYTTNGVRSCKNGYAAEYNYNGNNLSCLGTTSPMITCNLGNQAPCVVVQGCVWNYTTGECESSGGWQPYTPGYDSCTPNC
jgi:hypothetical protein